VLIKRFFLFIFFLYATLTCTHWKTWKKQKKYKAQKFYIEEEFECLWGVPLGDGGVSSYVTRRRKKKIPTRNTNFVIQI